MKFILLILVATFSIEGGVSVTSAEFNDKVSCEKAAAEVQDKFKSLMTQKPRVFCAEKGNDSKVESK